MAGSWHLWAIGYDNMERAVAVRNEIVRLGWERHCLILGDVAVVVRRPDGSFTIDREPFPTATNLAVCTAVGFLAGLAVASPLIGAACGALLGGAGNTIATAVGIDPGFIREVERLMQPGTSALFVLDDSGDMDVILAAIRGLGGTVLKANVDLDRARLIQSTLASSDLSPREGNGEEVSSLGAAQ
jgi:uncharacterized membrane protein